MSDPHEPMDSDTSEELYEIMRKSKKISVDTESDGVVFTAIVENISDITKLRTRRIALANERLPPRLKFLMIFHVYCSYNSIYAFRRPKYLYTCSYTCKPLYFYSSFIYGY